MHLVHFPLKTGVSTTFSMAQRGPDPLPGREPGAAGGLGPPPKECDPGRQGCRPPRSAHGLGSDWQGGYQASCPRSHPRAPNVVTHLKKVSWPDSIPISDPLQLHVQLTTTL